MSDSTTLTSKPTLSGDPFVDVGAAALQLLLEQHPEWDAKAALRFVTNVYVSNWQGKLHGFFLNSSITNPANKGKEVERSLEYYEALLSAESTQEKGWCRVSGQYEPLFSAGRENQILAGSGTFLNFHHGLDKGLQLGSRALLHIYFAPLGCIQVGDKAALVHSNRADIISLLTANNLKENLRPATAELEPGLAKSKRGNPANALFAYADAILKEAKREARKLLDGQPPALTLYHFTNFGAKPDIALYHLSAAVFEFYQNAMSFYHEPWTWFVRAHYRSSKFRGARARADTTALLLPGKPTEAPTPIEPDTYQTWTNSVYLRLIQGQSLLPLLREWARSHPFPFALTAYYCEKLLYMDRKTLELIAHVARHVATETDDSSIKRILTRLSTARTGSEVRLMLVGLQRRNYELHKDSPTPLLRLEEYVRYLFPDGTSWREIRDLLLISLYEQLHESNRQIELEEGMEEVAVPESQDEYIDNE